MTVKWVLGEAPRENIQIVNGLQFVEPATAGFITNRLANMSWLTEGITTPPPFGIPGVIAFETAGDIQLSPGTPTALDMLTEQVEISGQISNPTDRIPPGSLLAVEVAPAIGPADFRYFTINFPDFNQTPEQLQQIVGPGSDFALLGTDINSPPLSIPVPGQAPPPPPGPPAAPPLPTTPTEEAPKKKSSRGMLIGAGTGALLGIIAGGLPGLIVGAAGGAILGKVATK